MKKRVFAMCLAAGVILLPCLVLAQAKRDGLGLYHQARQLARPASSGEHLRLAAEKYEEALVLLEKAGDEESTSKVYHQLANVYWRLNKYDKSLECLNHLLDYYRKQANEREIASILNNKGILYKDLSEYDKAQECYAEAMEICEGKGASRLAANIQNNLGNIYRVQRKYDEALESFGKALSVAKQLDDVKLQGQAVGNLGTICFARGEYQQALQHFFEARRIFGKLNDIRFEARTCRNLGNVYHAMGDHDRALEQHKEAMKRFTNVGDLGGQAWTLKSLGIVSSDRKDFQAALKDFLSAQDLLKQIGGPTRRITDDIGNAYLDLGDIEKAEAYIKKAGYSVSLGRLSLAKDNYWSAKNYYSRVLEYARKDGNVNDLFSGYTGLGKACEGRREYKKAAECYSKAAKLLEKFMGKLEPDQRKSFLNVRIGGFFRSEPAEGLARVRKKVDEES